MYKEGYGQGGIGSFFNRFKLKFAFLQDNQEKSSIHFVSSSLLSMIIL
jgi:hypothetical protein